MTETYAIGKLFSRLLLFNLSVFPNTPEREVNWFLQLLSNRDLLLFILHRIPQYQIYLACSGWKGASDALFKISLSQNPHLVLHIPLEFQIISHPVKLRLKFQKLRNTSFMYDLLW